MSDQSHLKTKCKCIFGMTGKIRSPWTHQSLAFQLHNLKQERVFNYFHFIYFNSFQMNTNTDRFRSLQHLVFSVVSYHLVPPVCTPPGLIPLALILKEFGLNSVITEKWSLKALNLHSLSGPRTCTHFPRTAQSSRYYFVLDKISSLYRKQDLKLHSSHGILPSVQKIQQLQYHF